MKYSILLIQWNLTILLLFYQMNSTIVRLLQWGTLYSQLFEPWTYNTITELVYTERCYSEVSLYFTVQDARCNNNTENYQLHVYINYRVFQIRQNTGICTLQLTNCLNTVALAYKITWLVGFITGPFSLSKMDISFMSKLN
jgi:hypothetical protein